MELFIFRDGPTSVRDAFGFYLPFAFFRPVEITPVHTHTKIDRCLPTLMRGQLDLRDRSHISRGRGFSIAADFDWDSQPSTAAGL